MSAFDQATPNSGGPTTIAGITGVQIDLEVPLANQIEWQDIARGLSMECRFSGQVANFYSVAEHSVFVHDILLAWGNMMTPPSALRYALLHDAPEGFILDVPKPLKIAMERIAAAAGAESPYAVIERRFEAAVLSRFGMEEPTAAERSLVKRADLVARSAEGRRLKPEEPCWRDEGEEPPPSVRCAFGLTPPGAEYLFLDRGSRLGLWPSPEPLPAVLAPIPLGARWEGGVGVKG